MLAYARTGRLLICRFKRISTVLPTALAAFIRVSSCTDKLAGSSTRFAGLSVTFPESPVTLGRNTQRANGLKPHLMRGFKVSRDPKFVEKLEDIVGLYMSQPEHALVLCCDEKSQVQALDRTQPGLPMKKGRAATMTHDYHQAAAPWGVHQRAGIAHRHRRVHRPSQHQSQAIHLDHDCARHLAKSHSRQLPFKF